MSHGTAVPPMLTTGLDLGDRTTHRCTLDAERRVTVRGRFPTTRESLQREFGGTPPQRIVIEAGSQSLWVSRFSRRCSQCSRHSASGRRRLGWLDS